MKDITLRQLKYFEALTRFEHFGRAAEASAITQPALSVQIKDLEETLGLALFERSARQVRLTAFGERFAERVHGILREVDGLRDLARASATGFAGRLRLGIIPTIAPYLLPQVLSELTRRDPGLDVHVRETITPRLIEELSDGRLDTAILALPIADPTFAQTPLFAEDLVLARPAEAQDTPVPDRAALREMRLLLLEEGHCLRDHALSFCDIRSGSLRQGLDGSSLSTLVQMVGAGIGVTVIPEMAVPIETRSAPVSVARLPGPQPARTVGMIWRKTTPLAAQLERLAAVVREVARA